MNSLSGSITPKTRLQNWSGQVISKLSVGNCMRARIYATGHTWLFPFLLVLRWTPRLRYWVALSCLNFPDLPALWVHPTVLSSPKLITFFGFGRCFTDLHMSAHAWLSSALILAWRHLQIPSLRFKFMTVNLRHAWPIFAKLRRTFVTSDIFWRFCETSLLKLQI